MIAVDTNILVYAHRRDSPFHERAAACIQQLAEGASLWAIPWPCVHEFLAIVTNPRIYKKPTPAAAAVSQVEAWLGSPKLRLLAEGEAHEGYWPLLARLVTEARLAGGSIHDARVAALAIHHGVRELLTADRDFGRFKELEVRNPVV